MQIKNYITNDIKPLELKDTVKKAKNLFNNLIFTHLPVVDNKKLVGLVIEEDILNIDDTSKKIKSLQYQLEYFYADENDNWFQVFQKLAATEANILPILNENKEYLGYIELQDILHTINNTPFLSEEGTVLIVSIAKENYSFSRIAQIIESNNATLFGAFISNLSGGITEVTLKLSSENINAIIQTFRRYNYKIELGLHEDVYLQEMKERSGYLQKYLDI
jgi:predicted transcriptional regulator